MSNDDFTTAARAESMVANGMEDWDQDVFLAGAEWARDHLAAQEPTTATCGCDLSGMTPPAVHIVDGHPDPADAAQEPTDAEVEAAAISMAQQVSLDADPDLTGYRVVARRVLEAARRVRQEGQS